MVTIRGSHGGDSGRLCGGRGRVLTFCQVVSAAHKCGVPPEDIPVRLRGVRRSEFILTFPLCSRFICILLGSVSAATLSGCFNVRVQAHGGSAATPVPPSVS